MRWIRFVFLNSFLSFEVRYRKVKYDRKDYYLWLVSWCTHNCFNVSCFVSMIDSQWLLSLSSSCQLSASLNFTWLLFPFYSQANPGLPSSHHRRVACSFRDQCLFQIFQISLTSLHQLKNDGKALDHQAASIMLWILIF